MAGNPKGWTSSSSSGQTRRPQAAPSSSSSSSSSSLIMNKSSSVTAKSKSNQSESAVMFFLMFSIFNQSDIHCAKWHLKRWFALKFLRGSRVHYPEKLGSKLVWLLSWSSWKLDVLNEDNFRGMNILNFESKSTLDNPSHCFGILPRYQHSSVSPSLSRMRSNPRCSLSRPVLKIGNS